MPLNVMLRPWFLLVFIVIAGYYIFLQPYCLKVELLDLSPNATQCSDFPGDGIVYSLEELEVGEFDLANPVVREFAKIVDQNLVPWRSVPGLSGTAGKGLVKTSILQSMGTNPAVMSCFGHVKIVDGKVYFRYGGFVEIWYRLLRFHQSLKMIEEAIKIYKLDKVKAEFYLSTCDHPTGYDNSIPQQRAGFPLFGFEKTHGVIDMIVPDPLDLSAGYFNSRNNTIRWELKVPKVVFRGGTTNFELGHGNWGASPRIRLHRLTDIHPDLIDARIVQWSHATYEDRKKIEAEGLELGKRMDMRTKSGYKYEIVVDGGVGSCRTCGVFSSDQVMFRQGTPFVQFFEPMLVEGHHYVKVKHNFEDLAEKVEYAKKNEERMKQMVRRANQVAKWACTWEGRTLFWAVVLAKYPFVIDHPERITAPTSVCSGNALLNLKGDPKYVYPFCETPEAENQRRECMYFCTNGKISPEKYVWLTTEQHLATVPKLGPRQRDFADEESVADE